MTTIERNAKRISLEYSEPFRHVVTGFLRQGRSISETASLLELPYHSLYRYCRRYDLRPVARTCTEEHTEAIRRARRAQGRIVNGRSLADWAEQTGINYSTLHARISRGWVITRALEPTR